MFLEKIIQRNHKLLECGFDMHSKGLILPDTYVLDLDTIKENARMILEKANEYNIDLYFMLKQIGRNPIVAKALIDIGYKGAVVVDYKEALCMIDNGIHICNVGHLVQIPDSALNRIIKARPDYVTVYSYEKIERINEICKKNGLVQKLMIRLNDDDSDVYSGQVGGFKINELQSLIDKVNKLENVEIKGVTVFPALLFDENKKEIVKTDNIKTLERGLSVFKENGITDLNINLPSATCVSSIPLIKQLGGTSGEPGHGLTGTTPLHKYSDQPEIPAYIYVSEISHNYDGKSYCYGGGHYRRSHMENVVVGNSINNMKMSKVVSPSDESIDYHYEIVEPFNVGDCVVMAYRTQIFTTRSTVAVVEGIQSGNYKLLGLFNSLGERINNNWSDNEQ